MTIRMARAMDWIVENFALLLPGVALGAILGAVLLHWVTT